MRLLLAVLCVGLGPAAATLLRAREQPPPQGKGKGKAAKGVPASRAPPRTVKSNLFHQGGDARHAKERKQDGQVCISITAYEDPEWIDALIANARKFTERSTKIAIHLDSKTEYDEAVLKNWDTDKVLITPKRVSTDKFHGGILYSHLLNAQALAKRWPHECQHFVMAASNMMWVRNGMESYVREKGMVQLTNISCNSEPYSNPFICDHPIMLDMVGGNYNQVAWSQPEGLFMPMDMVLEFSHYLDEWIRQNQWNVTTQIVEEKGQFEEYWLQTWARNKHPDVVAKAKEGRPAALSFRMLGEGVTMDQVRQVERGERKEFAVKRVNRDFAFPTTRYIMKLSK